VLIRQDHQQVLLRCGRHMFPLLVTGIVSAKGRARKGSMG